MTEQQNVKTPTTQPPTATIYTRRTASYNPGPDMIEIESLRNDGSKQLYLEIKYRIQWFNVWCEENRVDGTIDESDISILGEGPSALVLARSTVYLRGAVAGKSAAAVPLHEPDGSVNRFAVQLAGTYATGRALAKAGFGTANAGSASEYGREETCDAGIPTWRNPVQYQTDPDNDMILTDVVVKTGPEKKAETEKPKQDTGKDNKRTNEASAPPARNRQAEGSEKPRASQPPAERKPSQAPATQTAPTSVPQTSPAAANGEPQAFTLEDAYKYVCPIGQKTKGKTLSEVNALFPSMIEFYASDKFLDNGNQDRAALKAACKVVYADTQAKTA